MTDRSGQQLGNYRLIRLLGKGGFAEVYLGEHIYLKIPVAVKVLYTQLEGADMTGFLKEAQTIASLMHPHIVRVTDFGLAGETPYLVMDYAPNGTLRQRHPRGTHLPLSTISAYVRQVAEALQYAHVEKKLVHRDIKPENMLLGRNNDILLSDFGIATVAARTTTQNTQLVAGTSVYMAPELFRGKPYTASDQYSLAIVVYEWICGEPPFHQGDFIQLGYQHTYVPPEPLHDKVPTIPREVEQVVLTALNKEPKQRFLTVHAFANAFEQASLAGGKDYVAPLPPTPRPVTPTPPPSPGPTPAPPVATREYTSTMQEASFASSGSYPGRVTSNNVVGSKLTTTASIERTESPWRIGRRQLVAAAIGFVIYGILNYLLDLVFVRNTYNSPFYNPFYTFNLGSLSVPFSPSSILSALILVIPIFFAVCYGPWAGLTVILAAGYIGDLLSGYIATYSVTWNWYVGVAILGFIASLAFITTRGRYDHAGSIVKADFLAAIGIVAYIGFATLSDIGVNHIPAGTAWSNFGLLAIPYILLVVIVLPIVLVIYNNIVKGRRR